VPAGVYSVAFTPDGRTLAAAGFGGRTYLWNLATRSLIGKLTDPAESGVPSVAFSPNGRILGTGDYNGSSYLWDVTARHLIATLTGAKAAGVYSVAGRRGREGAVARWP
jgi:WD40 repeat protein